MMTKTWATLLTAPALLTACVPAPQTPPVAPESGECNAAPAQNLVGLKGTGGVGAQIVQVTGSRNLRWIGPNQAVTMDYRTDRVNVYHTSDFTITQITCG